MIYHANSAERERLIAGLRHLADFLGQNPDVPAPRYAEVIVFPARGSNAEMFAEIDVIARQIGATASSAGSPAGHYSAARDFGPVRYRAVAIPDRDDENERGVTAMFLHVILGAVALLAGASATVLALLILGIRRGDRGKRLTGQPGSRSEMLSQRVLTGSRGCDSRDHAEEGQ